MTSPAEDVAQYLNDQAVGVLGASSGWGIFIGREPTAPETVITVYDTGGVLGNPDQLYDPNIQVRIRAPNYEDGYAKGAEIRDGLAVNITDKILGAWHYSGFFLTSDVAKIATDENNREIFTINFRLMREPYSTA